VVVVPVPWDVTVSYKDGTSSGPEAILRASVQVDLFDPGVPDAWKIGIAMDELPSAVADKAAALRPEAVRYIDAISSGQSPENGEAPASLLPTLNAGSVWLNEWVEARCGSLLDRGQLVALLGGDHSTPFGYMKALAARHNGFGILQIDAHADLREAYEGFTYSHASIMRNALTIPQVSTLVPVGIRDYCDEEARVIDGNPTRIRTFFDRELKHAQYAGATWATQVRAIVDALPAKVYVSFDIDGLDPKLCPHTGTPVAGGFEFEQAIYLLEQVVRSGRTIIGCDLNEVAPGPNDEWDANVGARLLYRMCNLMAVSHGRA